MQNSISVIQNETTFDDEGRRVKDLFDLNINGVILGTWEVSDLRHLIECIDNKLPWKIREKKYYKELLQDNTNEIKLND